MQRRIMVPLIRSLSHTAGLALWLVPPPSPANADSSSSSSATSAHSFISSLQHHVRTKLTDKDAPACAPFPPHATLLSGLKADDGGSDGAGEHAQLWARALGVVARWKGELEASRTGSSGSVGAITTPMLDVVTRGWYFQILVIALQPTEELRRLNEIAKQELLAPSSEGDAARKKPYFPHVSLLYSDISAGRAQEIIDEIKREARVLPLAGGGGVGGKVGKRRGGVDLRGDDDGRNDELQVIDFTHLELWDCNGEVGRWRCLERVRLADVAAAEAAAQG